MVNESVWGKLLFPLLFFLSACSATVGLTDNQPAVDSLSAAEMNAAAEKAAAESTAPAEEGVTDQPIESSDADSSPAGQSADNQAEAVTRINRRVAVDGRPRVAWLIPYDGIRPVYDPQFATAEEAPLDDDELVLGISIDGEAKAYPITVLHFREMVNDELAGIPTLVTW